MVYILPLQGLGKSSVGANVSSEINTAIVTIDLGTVNTGSIFY
jgi:shikimate kinase